jgi:heat shock protein HtpX
VEAQLPASLVWLRRRRQARVDVLAERLLARMSGVDAARTAPPFSGPRLLLALLALPVHLVTVGLVALSAWGLVAGHGASVRFLGVLGLLVAITLRPRLGRAPEHVASLRPADAPRLFDLLGRIAGSTGAPLPHQVVVSTQFNASASRAGLRRRVLEIGAPLWVASHGQERVALLGHELGHFAHGDLRSGLLPGAAWSTLVGWYEMACPEQVVASVALAPLRWAIAGYLFLIDRINATSSRRQEYLADLDAAQVGGSEGAIAMLDVLLVQDAAEAAMTRAAVRSDRPDMWEQLRSDVAERHGGRLARRRTESAQRSRADSTHPKTTLRIDLLESRPRVPAGVVVDSGTWRLLDAELEAALVLAARRAGDEIRFVR